MLLVSQSASRLGATPGALGAQSRPVRGSSHLRWPHHLTVTSVSRSLPGARCPRLPWRGGCDVPSVHLSGCRPCHPDTCLTCLTRAMPVASPPCGLCVGGWGRGLAPSGWTVGAWSWHRPQPQGTLRQVVAWTRAGSSHPRRSRGPAGGVLAAPRESEDGWGGPQSVGHRSPQTEGQEGKVSLGTSTSAPDPQATSEPGLLPEPRVPCPPALGILSLQNLRIWTKSFPNGPSLARHTLVPGGKGAVQGLSPQELASRWQWVGTLPPAQDEGQAPRTQPGRGTM